MKAIAVCIMAVFAVTKSSERMLDPNQFPKVVMEELNKRGIDTLPSKTRPVDKALRLPLQDVYKISGTGTVPAGRVETGILKSGMSVNFCPSGIVAEVDRVENQHEQLTEAKPGDLVGFNVKNVAVNQLERGNVASPANDPMLAAQSFNAMVKIVNHRKISAGYSTVLDIHHARIAHKFDKFFWKVNQKGEVIENPKEVENGDWVYLRLIPQKPVCVEPFVEYSPLGTFEVNVMGETVVVGVICEVEPVAKKKE